MNEDWRNKFPVGTKVRILKPHYHAGKTGIVVEHFNVNYISNNPPAITVKLEGGLKAGILEEKAVSIVE
jgi:hypothetical protein